MFTSSARKILLGALVLALAATGAFVVFAQEEDNAETSACALRHRGMGYNTPLDALAELDMTIGELRDHLVSGGTIEELLDESDLRADREATQFACIDELEANGDLTGEQAAALRAVIETGARQAMRDALESRGWGKGGEHAWGKRGGPGIEIRRFFDGRGMPLPVIPDFFRSDPFGSLDELFAELEESGSLDEAMRERLEQFEEALRSGGRGRFGFRIDRDDDGKWHFDWFGQDDDDTEQDTSDETQDPDASADNSA